MKDNDVLAQAAVRRRRLCSALAVATVVGPALGQPVRRVARVGWLGWTGDTAPRPSDALQAFRDGLAAGGWHEGDNLQLETRSGDRDQGAALGASLVRSGVEVVVAQGPMAIFARTAIGTTPMVITINGDPVAAGLVASLARPGGTISGVTAMNTELSAKRVELLKASRPALTRFAVLANDRHPGVRAELEATAAAARTLGCEMKYLPVQVPQDFDAAFAAIAREKVSGLVAFPDTLINLKARAIAEFATPLRLPAISGWSEFALAGNLMSYGPDYREFFRLAAAYVDRLLRGAKAAELPVEQPKRVELALNLRVAKALGLVLPQTLLLRADRVIE